jgi:hypothetical protein
LIEFYYKHSPEWASWISESETRRWAARILLTPLYVVGLLASSAALGSSSLAFLLSLSLLFFSFLMIALWAFRKKSLSRFRSLSVFFIGAAIFALAFADSPSFAQDFEEDGPPEEFLPFDPPMGGGFEEAPPLEGFDPEYDSGDDYRDGSRSVEEFGGDFIPSDEDAYNEDSYEEDYEERPSKVLRSSGPSENIATDQGPSPVYRSNTPLSDQDSESWIPPLKAQPKRPSNVSSQSSEGLSSEDEGPGFFEKVRNRSLPTTAEIYSERVKNSNRAFGLRFNLDPIKPGGESGALADNFETAYGEGDFWGISISHEEFLLREAWGSFSWDASLGLRTVNGEGRFVSSGEVSDRVSFRFYSFPLTFGVNYYLDMITDYVVPFAGISAVGIPYIETRDDDIESFEGFSFGTEQRAGIQISLDWMNWSDSWSLSRSFGVNRSFLYVAFRNLSATSGLKSGFESDDDPIEFSGSSVDFGFRLEY